LLRYNDFIVSDPFMLQKKRYGTRIPRRFARQLLTFSTFLNRPFGEIFDICTRVAYVTLEQGSATFLLSVAKKYKYNTIDYLKFISLNLKFHF